MVSGQRRTARPQSVSVAGWLRQKISAAHGHPEPQICAQIMVHVAALPAINNRRYVIGGGCEWSRCVMACGIGWMAVACRLVSSE